MRLGKRALCCVVRVVGFEPTSLAAQEPKSCTYTNFVIPANRKNYSTALFPLSIR